MKSNLDSDYNIILEDIVKGNSLKNTSDFVCNNLYEIVEDHIDIDDYKQIMKSIKSGSEKTLFFDEIKEHII